MSATLRELADRFGCELHGDAERVVARVGTLSAAAPDAVTFLANPLYRPQLAATRAAAVILEERYRAECPVPCLVHPQPYLTYARVATYLHPAPPAVPGVHESAAVAADARVAPTAEIGAHAVIGDGCTLDTTCAAGNCFTASAYGDMDADNIIAVVLLARPDQAGNDCRDLMLGLPPIDKNAVTVHDRPLTYPDLLAAGKY